MVYCTSKNNGQKKWFYGLGPFWTMLAYKHTMFLHLIHEVWLQLSMWAIYTQVKLYNYV